MFDKSSAKIDQDLETRKQNQTVKSELFLVLDSFQLFVGVEGVFDLDR